MAGVGPTPKPAGQRARRNATYATTLLPAAGRPGRAPKWPLPPDRSLSVAITVGEQQVEQLEDEVDQADGARARAGARRRLNAAIEKLARDRIVAELQQDEEARIWRDLWRTPQAVEWERLRWNREVARYVRHVVKGEGGSLEDSREARQLADRIGLTPAAMLRLRWAVTAEFGAPAPGRRSKKNQRYAHLKVVGD